LASFDIINADYTSNAKTAILNLLRGGSAAGAWGPTFIDIGTGGNLNLSGVDTHARFAPDPSETELRRRIFRANIVYTELVGESSVKYVAAVDAHEAISSDINEFGLIASNQLMIAHLVLPATATPPYPAETFDKTGYVRLMLYWAIDLSLVF